MKRLFLLDYFRGPDSTGFASIRNNGDVHIAKVSSHPLDLFDMTKFKSALNGTNSSVFLGHNRAATRGAVNTANAHPFQYDHIVGAHNGTLDYQSTKALEDAVGEMFLVDSQAIFAAIAKLGIAETISLMREGLDSSTGAWALSWYDTEEKTMNFLRNKHRPLWYAYEKGFERLFWASEWQMIDSAARLFGDYELFQEEPDPKTGKAYRFRAMEENVHYAFDVELLAKGGDAKPKPKAKVLKGKEPLPAVKTGGHDPFSRMDTGGGGMTPTTRSGTSSSTLDKKVVHLLGDLNDPLGGRVDYTKFLELSKYGCSFCRADVSFYDLGVTVYERDDMLLCADCSGNNGQSRIYTKSPILAQ